MEAPRAALGEVAASGPDVEIVIDNPSADGSKIRGEYVFRPPVVSALAGRPKFVLFINRTLACCSNNSLHVDHVCTGIVGQRSAS